MTIPTDPAEPVPARSRGVLIARGSGEPDLRALSDLLERAGVEYHVEEELRADGTQTHELWQVFVRPGAVLAARRALQPLMEAEQSQSPPGTAAPSPGPLFDGGSRGLTLRLVTLGCFGLGFVLLFRSCTG